MTETVATPPEEPTVSQPQSQPARRARPRSVVVHMVYCLVQGIIGLLMMGEAVIVSLHEGIGGDKIVRAFTTISPQNDDVYLVAVVAFVGVVMAVTHGFGLWLISGRGLWRWRVWLVVGPTMMILTICSPVTLALGIPALIMWALPSTRFYLDPDAF